jgi:hypothetical protein
MNLPYLCHVQLAAWERNVAALALSVAACERNESADSLERLSSSEAWEYNSSALSSKEFAALINAAAFSHETVPVEPL